MEKVVKSVKQVGDFESQYGHFYKWLLEFEDGFNRKSIVDTNQDPFSNEISNDLFTETDGNTENNNDTEGNPFA